MNVHAIYTVLSEADLLSASISSIYNFVDGITIITGYDRDWKGGHHEPDELLDVILSRVLDPDRKINLIITAESNEARARNRAMDFAAPRRTSRRVVRQHSSDSDLQRIDYFWIIDADEIYEGRSIPAIFDYLGSKRSAYYQVAARSYFKTWNYPIETYEWFTAFVRADHRCGALRNPYPRRWMKFLNHVVPSKGRFAHVGVARVPVQIGYFHHGSYVGPRQRIERKLRAFGHSEQIPIDWLDSVWEPWDIISSRNFHPVTPSQFPRARKLLLADLPPEIGDWPWPTGYLDGRAMTTTECEGRDGGED